MSLFIGIISPTCQSHTHRIHVWDVKQPEQQMQPLFYSHILFIHPCESADNRSVDTARLRDICYLATAPRAGERSPSPLVPGLREMLFVATQEFSSYEHGWGLLVLINFCTTYGTSYGGPGIMSSSLTSSSAHTS